MLAGGAAYYAYKNVNVQQATPEQGAVSGGLVGLLAGYYLQAQTNTYGSSKKGVATGDREKWLRKYNRGRRDKYVSINGFSGTTFAIVPESSRQQYLYNQRKREFDALIAKGDRALRGKDFNGAISYYEQAEDNGHDPDFAIEKKQQVKRAEFDQLIINGDHAVEGKNFNRAYNYYEEALRNGYDPSFVQEKKERAKRAEFNHYISNGDAYLARYEKTQARTYYERARSMGVDNQLAEDKIGRIDTDSPKPKDFITGFEAKALFDDNIFPSFIISMASYEGDKEYQEFGDISSGLVVVINSRLKNVPLKLEIESAEDKYFKPFEMDITIPESGRLAFMPNVPWKMDPLRHQTSSTPLKIFFRIKDKNGNKMEHLETFTMQGINECLFSYDDKDFRFLFAAYVDEEHDAIEEILQTGLNKGYVNSWIGYQGGEAGVDKQVAAVWRILNERGFSYSNVIPARVADGKINYQFVRRFGESLKGQANCIDGTVALASILQKLGLHTVLVFQPGHAYLGYYTTPYEYGKKRDMSDLRLVETTQLGRQDILKKGMEYTEGQKQTAYYLAFEKAKLAANINLIVNAPKTHFIDVTSIRKMVKPIGE